jgi:hypothetical protein
MVDDAADAGDATFLADVSVDDIPVDDIDEDDGDERPQ